jgi:hypothetical protein
MRLIWSVDITVRCGVGGIIRKKCDGNVTILKGVSSYLSRLRKEKEERKKRKENRQCVT